MLFRSVLAELVVADGGTVTSGQLIARIDTEGKVSAAAAPVAAQVVQAAAAPKAAAQAKSSVAMPAAAKLMADHQLPAGALSGTGKDGRVTKGDVLDALQSGSAQAKTPAAPAAAPAPAPPPAARRR